MRSTPKLFLLGALLTACGIDLKSTGATLTEGSESSGGGTTSDDVVATSDGGTTDDDGATGQFPPPYDPQATTEGTSESSDPTSGGTEPSTAGDDGGVPGGAGDGAVSDPEGDVSLSEADALAAAAYTDGEMIDLRIQVVAPLGDLQATYQITWCIDAGIDGAGTCGNHASGVEAYMTWWYAVDPGHLDGDYSPCLYGAFESETNTYRALIPVDAFVGTSEFSWIATINFGGSGGDAELVPDAGWAPVLAVAELPPFSGEPLCP